jgi:hypothetical protein
MSTDLNQNEQAAVAQGVQTFVDSLATTICETMAVAGDKVALEAAVLRQKYKFDAFRSVMSVIQSQRDQLKIDYADARDDVERELIQYQLQQLSVQLNTVLMQAGVPSKVAITAANKSVAIEAVKEEAADKDYQVNKTPPVANSAGRKKKATKKKATKKRRR